MAENVIVIPYRNRERHLEYYINNTLPIIKENLPNTKIVVVEQNEGKLFNRGALINVAFKEYSDKTKYFITNDVDTYPTKKCLDELYSKPIDDKHVFAIYSSQCNTLGGIIKITSNVIKMINGFPNNIWGWGVEDKALQNRTEMFNIKKIPALIARDGLAREYPEYLTRFNDVADRIRSSNFIQTDDFHYRIWPRISHKDKMKYITENGISTLKYTIIHRKQIDEIIEIIKVDFN